VGLAGLASFAGTLLLIGPFAALGVCSCPRSSGLQLPPVSAEPVGTMRKAAQSTTARRGGRRSRTNFGATKSSASARSLPGRSRRRRVEDGFDVVSVRIEHERGVVAAAVLGAQAGRPVVATAVFH